VLRRRSRRHIWGSQRGRLKRRGYRGSNRQRQGIQRRQRWQPRLTTTIDADSVLTSTALNAFSLSVLGAPVKGAPLSCFCCLTSFRGHVPCGGGLQSGSRWSARSAARTNDLEADEDPPHTLAGPRTRRRRCGSSHLRPPVKRAAGVHVARAGAQPYLGPRTEVRRHDDRWGARRAGCRRVRPLILSGKSTQQRGGDTKTAGARRRHQLLFGQGTCATHS